MDRLIVAEIPQVSLTADLSGGWIVDPSFLTDYVAVSGTSNTQYKHESTIDMTGYVLQDMTTYFRQSFEQRGSFESLQWSASVDNPLTSFGAAVLEHVFVTSVPMQDSDIIAAVFCAPGFTTPASSALTFGNFNRDHVIHGRLYLHGIDTTLAADAVTTNGAAYTRIVQQQDFSSLEPTAVDKLYVYRVFTMGASALLGGTGLNRIDMAPMRIMMDAMAEKEEDIPYLMRLKRGYELANQV